MVMGRVLISVRDSSSSTRGRYVRLSRMATPVPIPPAGLASGRPPRGTLKIPDLGGVVLADCSTVGLARKTVKAAGPEFWRFCGENCAGRWLSNAAMKIRAAAAILRRAGRPRVGKSVLVR